MSFGVSYDLRLLALAFIALCTAQLPIAAADQAVEKPASANDARPASADASGFVEVLVLADRNGPQIWRINGRRGSVVVFPVLSPSLPGDAWLSAEIRELIESADRSLFAQSDVGIGLGAFLTRRDAVRNPSGVVNTKVLDAETRTRLEAQVQRLDLDLEALERWRPYIVGGIVRMAASENAGLNADAREQDEVVRMLRRSGARPRNVGLPVPRSFVSALNAMPAGADAACLSESLDLVERHMDDLYSLTAAWSTGKVSVVRDLMPKLGIERCKATLQRHGVDLPAFGAQQIRAWVQEIATAADQPGMTFVVIDLWDWEVRDGVLNQLRARGMQIDGP